MTFDEYVAARGLALTRFAYVLTGDRQHAEDLVQTAFLKAFRHWSRVSSADHPDSYVRRIIVTTHLSWRRRLSSQEQPTADFPDTASSADDDPAERAAHRDVLRRALLSLPVRQRTVLVLRHYAGYDDAAITDLLGCGEGTVRAHASKGSAQLRLDLSTHRLPEQPI